MFIGNYFYYELPESLPQLTTTSFYFVAFVFLTFVLCRILKCAIRPYAILACSLFFLYSYGTKHIIAVVAVAALSFIAGLVLNKYKKWYVLALSLLPFVGLLVYFKYFNYESLGLVFPLGLSFYSFKVISYLVDIYKDEIEVEHNPIYYLDYVMFFPVITAGPIHRYENFRKEIREYKEFDYKDAKGGGFQMVLGVYEKVVFCDFVASVVSRCLNNVELTGVNVLIGIVLYSFQIYLDFDAISNISIGCSRLLGFNIEKNFNSPYLARTLKEFWSRWHISLSTWLKDYIYIPLGGNRKGKIRRYINLFITFVVSGLWHGNTVNFLYWGIAHALIQVVEDMIMSFFKDKVKNKIATAVISVIGVVINFAIVTLLWLIFKYENMAEVSAVLTRLSASGSFDLEAIGMTVNELRWLIVVISVTVILDVLRNNFDMIETFNSTFFVIRWLVYILMIVSFMIFGVYGGSFDASDFIYRWF